MLEVMYMSVNINMEYVVGRKNAFMKYMLIHEDLH